MERGGIHEYFIGHLSLKKITYTTDKKSDLQFKIGIVFWSSAGIYIISHLHSATRDQNAKAPAFDCHPIHIAMDLYGSYFGWWVHVRTDPCLLFGLSTKVWAY